jgi:hypothetical protein
MYSSAYYLTLYVVATGMKWTDLVKRSTMTHIELYPREVRDKPTMKSIADVRPFPLSDTQGLQVSGGSQMISFDSLTGVTL